VKVIFLGTNGWYDTKTGNTVSILIKTNSHHVILDAGYGLAKLDRYIEGEDKPAVLLLSHYHLDHTVGLHVLNKFNFPRGLKIGIPAGTKDYLNTLVNRPYTAPLESLPYEVDILELPGEEHQLYPLQVEARELTHVTTCLGYRIEDSGASIAYVPDTGYCENAVTLARNVDLLCAECAYAGDLSNDKWPHLNPLSAAKIAREAGVKRLVLFHFDALQYPSLAHRKEAERLARCIFPNALAARDGLSITVKGRLREALL